MKNISRKASLAAINALIGEADDEQLQKLLAYLVCNATDDRHPRNYQYGGVYDMLDAMRRIYKDKGNKPVEKKEIMRSLPGKMSIMPTTISQYLSFYLRGNTRGFPELWYRAARGYYIPL